MILLLIVCTMSTAIAIFCLILHFPTVIVGCIIPNNGKKFPLDHVYFLEYGFNVGNICFVAGKLVDIVFHKHET